MANIRLGIHLCAVRFSGATSLTAETCQQLGTGFPDSFVWDGQTRPESTEIGDALAQVVRGKELQSFLAGTPLL